MPDTQGQGTFTLDKKQMQSVCIGATVLASGGGGSYTVSTKIIEKGVPDGSVVTVIPYTGIGAGEWAAVAANMGSPSALFRTTNTYAPSNAFTTLERWCAANPEQGFEGFQKFGYVMPVEVGAINAAGPLTVGAQFGLSVVDGDGAGRSVPTLPLTIYAEGRYPLFPNYLASEAAPGTPFTTGQVNTANEESAELALIGLIMSQPFGGIAGLALYAANGAHVAAHPPVTGTMYDALRIGELYAATEGQARVDSIIDYLEHERPAGPRRAKQVFHGRITQMLQTLGGTDDGYIVVTADDGTQLWIYNQNENIFAYLSTSPEPLVMGPDSICYVPAHGVVYDNSDLWRSYQADPAKEREVYILAIDAPQLVKQSEVLPAAWQTARAQAGYGGPYVQPWL